KNRQPLAKMFFKADRVLNDYYKAILAEELNVKGVEEITDASGYLSYSFKPQLKTLGPKYGKRIGEIRTLLAALDGAKAKAALDRDGQLVLASPEGDIVLAAEDLLVETKQTEGFESVSDNNVIVALDTHITPKLLEEGFVREIISKLQTMRKDAGFEVLDHIAVYIEGNDTIARIAKDNMGEIMENVLAGTLEFAKAEGFTKEWDINGETVTFTVVKK
ncbi:MAG: DUF5915 domain-containing protein, partial [Oscillospiraceae bacterium]